MTVTCLSNLSLNYLNGFHELYEHKSVKSTLLAIAKIASYSNVILPVAALSIYFATKNIRGIKTRQILPDKDFYPSVQRQIQTREPENLSFVNIRAFEQKLRDFGLRDIPEQGEFDVIDTTNGQTVKAKLTVSNYGKNPYYKVFKAYVNDQEIGSARAYIYDCIGLGEHGRMAGRTVGRMRGAESDCKSDFYPYSFAWDPVSPKSYLELDRIDNFNERYKKTGTGLFQAAVEYSYSKGCMGYLKLNAVRDAHMFYIKMGMKDEFNTIPAKFQDPSAYKRGHDYGCERYVLYGDRILTISEKIKSSPVFVGSRENVLLLEEDDKYNLNSEWLEEYRDFFKSV
jgi:hypothetical protein